MTRSGFFLTLAAGCLGTAFGVVLQDTVIPMMKVKALSEEYVSVRYRIEGHDQVMILITNDSDEVLDVSKISINANVTDHRNDLGAFVEPSRVYLVEGSSTKNLVPVDYLVGGKAVVSIRSLHSLTPGSRDVISVRFVEPSLSEFTLSEISISSISGQKFVAHDGL